MADFHLPLPLPLPLYGEKPEQQPMRFLLCACVAAVIFPAVLQLILHPMISGGSARTWALYWGYTLLCVVLPGTMIAMSTIRWRADWLTWVGLGWALGHAFELVSFLMAREVGHPGFFLLWIPVAIAACWTQRREWHGRLALFDAPARTYGALLFIFAATGITFFALSLPEISTAPPYISDVWFHVNNAHEFRDHSPMQDPRLAGEPFNYHVFAYAASAAASVALSEPLAPIMTRYSGMSCVALFVFNLFNVGRAVGPRSIAAGVVAALLIGFPVDIGTLFHSRLDFGSTLPLFGLYLSATTLAGYVFLAPLLILIVWFYQGLRLRDGWVLTLLAFAGAGSKAMLGPVVVCGAAGVVGWKVLTERRFDWRSFSLVLFLVAGILPPLLPLLFADGSYAQSVRWDFVAFGRKMPFYDQFVLWGMPDVGARIAWLFGFDLLLLFGAAVASRFMRSKSTASDYVTFVWMSLIAALVPSLSISLHGASQLFFLYFANAILATIAGSGLVLLLRTRIGAAVLVLPAIAWLLLEIYFNVTLHVPAYEVDEENPPFTISRRAVIWWDDAVANRDAPVPESPPNAISFYQKKFYLTPEVREGLEWARTNLPADTVFVVNAFSAGPYNAYCECRAFFETDRFHVSSHVKRSTESDEQDYFAARTEVLGKWVRKDWGLVDAMMAAGVTHMFVDRVNGRPIGVPARLGQPVFANKSFKIFELPRKASG